MKFKFPFIIILLANIASFSASGTFTDPRDGQTYRIVKIGNQIWMAENLNYNTSGSKCYSNKFSNCEKYGRLYNWTTARTVCPGGWHLPTNAEWDKLFRFVDGTSGTESPYQSETAGKYLKAKSGWDSYYENSGNGLDKYGFTAIPGGLGFSDGSFRSIGGWGGWWSTSEYYGYAYYRYMGYGYERANYDNYEKSSFFSVRCLKD